MRSSSDSVTKVVADAYVVDTGVFLRWFVDQDGFEHARELQQKLVDGSTTVETVDFARVEVAGVLRKKGLLAGRLTVEEFTAAVRVIDDLGVTVHETTADRLERAAAMGGSEEPGNVRRPVRSARQGTGPAAPDDRSQAPARRRRIREDRSPARNQNA